MRLLTAAQMREADRLAMENHGVPGIDLMGRAGEAVADAALRLIRDGGRAVVLAGSGNNGGDGFVAACRLREAGVPVTVIATRGVKGYHGDAGHYLAEWFEDDGAVVEVTDDGAALPPLEGAGEGDVVIDALLGTGLKGAPMGRVAWLIDAARGWRAAGAKVVAVDIPSGLDSDTGRPLGEVLQADRTVTFAWPKRGHFLLPGRALSGEVIVADIGIPAAVLDSLGTVVEAPGNRTVRDWVPPVPVDTHKGRMGHLLVVAGGEGTAGAAALSSEAALRAGAGLVSLASRAAGLVTTRARVPEVMTALLDGEGALGGGQDVEATLALAHGRHAVAVGPGIPRDKETASYIGALIRGLEVPLLLDADALNAIAGDPSVLAEARLPVVVTPHPGEMARLSGESIETIQADRFGIAARFAEAWGAVVVLKGAGTVVASPEGELMLVTAGNPGLATAGSGDVLTGIIGALLAGGLDAFTAARAGAWLHARAGDLGALRVGQRGLIATDVIAALGEVWREWER